MIGSTALLLVASQLHGAAQTWTWVAVVVVDYAGTILTGASGWRLNSAAHVAERHGLILIIAIGESIVAIGVGVAKLPVSAPVIVASILGLTLAAAIWWAPRSRPWRRASPRSAPSPSSPRWRWR